jgi:hypothetical protein
VTEGPATPTPGDGGTGKDGRSLGELAKNPRLSLTALLAIVALIALAVWLVVESTGSDDSSPSATPTETTEPVALSANGLATLAAASGPIYWVGPRSGSTYELAQRDGQVFLRYLPSGAEAGDARALLTVGTYPVENAFNVTSGIQGSEKVPIPGGGVAVISKDRPNSAYVAYPGVEYQIELYDPNPAQVRRLATSGAVKPVPAPRASVEPRGPVAASEDDLVALSKELDHPVYWAGPRENARNELTVTADGSVYIRYLPPGKDVGASGGTLTVATYPVEDAYAVTQKGASGDGSAVVEAPGDGFAMRSKRSRTNVYLAFPGEDVQVEVYSPVPGQAERLVTQGDIVSVG